MRLMCDSGKASWRKSSYSGSDNNNCVEVADNLPGLIPVRDSKRPSGPVVVFSAEGWGPFVAAVRGGRL
ncbi:protein of unknown function [Streptomyces pini]|uniref:DUF397 domain-containing protein n=2 Tax=Streptomyces pini TaxID=1520580 RepID=A0A1I4IUW8_9ACTN|nr:protein of unknown function [Streptomyces pini]